MEEAATTDTANNINYGNHDAVAVALHNSSEVQVLLPLILLPVVIPYVGAPSDITSSHGPGHLPEDKIHRRNLHP